MMNVDELGHLFVFREGEVVGSTTLHPTVAAIRRRDKIDLAVNMWSSEPRWEAHGHYCYAIADDPNEAVLACAFASRHGFVGLVR